MIDKGESGQKLYYFEPLLTGQVNCDVVCEITEEFHE